MAIHVWSYHYIPVKSTICITYEEEGLYLRLPLVFSLDAMLTVSPNMQYLGFMTPITAATTGPVWIPRMKR